MVLHCYETLSDERSRQWLLFDAASRWNWNFDDTDALRLRQFRSWSHKIFTYRLRGAYQSQVTVFAVVVRVLSGATVRYSRTPNQSSLFPFDPEEYRIATACGSVRHKNRLFAMPDLVAKIRPIRQFYSTCGEDSNQLLCVSV